MKIYGKDNGTCTHSEFQNSRFASWHALRTSIYDKPPKCMNKALEHRSVRAPTLTCLLYDMHPIISHWKGRRHRRYHLNKCTYTRKHQYAFTYRSTHKYKHMYTCERLNRIVSNEFTHGVHYRDDCSECNQQQDVPVALVEWRKIMRSLVVRVSRRRTLCTRR